MILSRIEPHILLAQLVGACGMITLFIMYRQTDRRKYLIFKLSSDIIWACHYFMLSAIGGAIPNMVGVVRELVFMRDIRRSAKAVWAAVFIAVNAALAIWRADSLIQFIPICASALVTVSLTFRSTSHIRYLSIPISLAFLVYDLLVGSLAGAVNEILSLISMVSKVISEHRETSARKK